MELELYRKLDYSGNVRMHELKTHDLQYIYSKVRLGISVFKTFSSPKRRPSQRIMDERGSSLVRRIGVGRLGSDCFVKGQ